MSARLLAGRSFPARRSGGGGVLPGALHQPGFHHMTALWLIVLCGLLAIAYAGLGDPIGAGGRCRQRADAGDRGGRARGRAGLSQAPIHHHRHRRRRHLLHSRLAPGLAGRDRLPDRRGALGRDRLHRHERLGARQRAHRAGGDRLARRRARARLQGRRDHRPAGRGPRAARRHHLFRLADRTAEICRQTTAP